MGEKTVVCDTDVLIDYLNEKNARNRTTTIMIEDIIGLDNVIISSVSKMELLVGAKNKFDLKSIEKQIKHFNVGLINNEIATIAMDLVIRYN